MADTSLNLGQAETLEFAQAATDLVNNPNALGRVILSKMDTPPPLLKDCVHVFQKNPTKDKVKKIYYKDLIQAFVKKDLGAKNAPQISDQNDDCQDLMAEMLVQANDLCDFKRKNMHILAQVPQSKYLKAKEALEAKIGAPALAHLMNVLMKASSKEENGEKAFGLLFYAEAYGNNQFQDIADIANATRLTSYKSSGNPDNPMPTEIDLHENLFGKNPTQFISIPLASKVGHILVPKNPAQSDTVYLVYEGDYKVPTYNFVSMPAFEVTHEGGDIHKQATEYLNKQDSSKKDIIYSYQDQNGQKWFTGIGLNGQPYTSQLERESFLKEAQKKGWISTNRESEDLLQLSQEIAKIQHDKNGQNVNWKPNLKVMKNTLDPELDKIPVALPSFFSKFPNELSKGLGPITKLIETSRSLGLTKIVEAQERKLHRYARYLAIRPVLQFLAEQVIPIAGRVTTGALVATVIPIPGISTAAGALIGLGIGVAEAIYKGYQTYHYHKQLKAEAAKRGIKVTVKSYSKFKAEADSALDSVLASPNPTLLLSQTPPEPVKENKVPPPHKLPKPNAKS